MADPATWLLWAWLCSGPGASGECAPLPDRPMPSRVDCLRAARALHVENPQVVAHCRRVPAAGDG